MHFDPKKKGLLVLSFGAGQDSTAIFYRLVQEPLVRASTLKGRNIVMVFADTGDEREETYDHAWATYDLAKSLGVKFAHLASEETAQKHKKKGRSIGHILTGYNQASWTSLSGQYLRNHNLAIRNNKSCTDNLKIRPIYKWLDHLCDQLMDNDETGHKGKKHIIEYAERYGKIEVMIGFTKGEERRIKKAHKPGKQKWWQSIDKTFPLADWGFTRMDCIAYMDKSPWGTCPPSMCKMCPNITKHTLVLMWFEDRWSFIEWCRHEKRKLNKWAAIQEEKGKANTTALGRKHNLIGELRAALEELSHMSLDEIREYHFTHGHCISNGY